MFKRKAVACLLAILCIFSLFLSGCNTGTVDESTPPATESNPAQGSSEDHDPLGVYDPAISFNYAYRTNPITEFDPGDTLYDNLWTRELEKYGINMNIMWEADFISGSYDTKLNMSLTAGDIPDVFTGNYETMYTAYQAGLLADLTDVFEQYASDELKAFMRDNENLFAGAYIDGKLVAYPMLGDPSEILTSYLWIRQDWMDNLGLEAPKTLEDVIEIARAFTYDDPDGNGKNDTYGLGLYKDLFSQVGGDIRGIAAAYGVPTLAREDGDMWYMGSDGKVTNGNIQPEMKEALLTLQGMYADGLIDPEFGVKDLNALAEDINQNKVGIVFGSYNLSFWPFTTNILSDINAIFKAYPVPAAEGYEVKLPEAWPVSLYYMQNSNCENPELLIKLLNINIATVNEYSDYETIDRYTTAGKWMLAPVTASSPAENTARNMQIAEAIKNNDGGVNLSVNGKMQYDWIMEFINDRIVNENYQYGWWGAFGPEGATGIAFNDYVVNNKLVPTVVTGLKPDSMVDKLPNLLDMRAQVFTEIIMGGSIDKFDTFVTDWLKAGGQEILDDLQAIYG